MTDYTDLAVVVDTTLGRTLTAQLSGAAVAVQIEPFARSQFRVGTGSISGTLRVDGVVAARKVRLLDVRTGQLVAETMSDVAGAYVFTDIDSSALYAVIGQDTIGAASADIEDKVTPI